MVVKRSVNEVVEKLAAELEKIEEMKMPEWAKFVKTGVGKERPPLQKNWWYLRAASILRKVYIHKNIGVNRLRSLYGSRKNRGSAPEHMYKASGKVIRTILQQLEKAGLVKKEKGGRAVTKKFIDMLKKIEGGE